MIARVWEGCVPAHRAGDYLALMRDVALPDYRATPGNRGAWCLHRAEGGAIAVRMLSFWDSRAAIAAFAGADISRAVYYDFDPDYLIAMAPTVDHYEIAGGPAPAA